MSIAFRRKNKTKSIKHQISVYERDLLIELAAKYDALGKLESAQRCLVKASKCDGA